MLPRTIVSVLDSSDVVQDAAMAWTSSLARWAEADLHVVHVRRAGRAATAERARRDELAGRIRRLVAASGAERVTVVPAVLQGRPVRAIADYRRRVAADLVVVTNRARRSSGYWRAGSFAAALGKAVAVPTIVLPDGLPLPTGSASPFRHIVSAIDFSAASFLGLSEALNLAQRSGATLTLVHVRNGRSYETVSPRAGASRLSPHLGGAVHINRELRRLIPPDAMNWSKIDAATVAGEAGDGLLTVASRARADLIVLGLPRRSRVEELVAGTTVHGVHRRAASPVLLVPGPATPPSVQLAEERAVRRALNPSGWGGAPAGGRGEHGMAIAQARVDLARWDGARRTLLEAVRAEYTAMPGLSLTLPQAQRLWTVDRQACQDVFSLLVGSGVLKATAKGRFVLG